MNKSPKCAAQLIRYTHLIGDITVKKKLNTLLSNIENNISDFVVDPKRDFVRKSELSFSKTMRFILGMGSKTLGGELMEFYGLDKKSVSVSAVVQRRAKILPAAFLHLFHKFNESFSQTCFFHGYRLYAVDGSDIHIPTDPDDKDTFYRANNDVKGYNLMHLNALYDLMNRRYIDAVLQDSRNENEHSALISMLENIGHDAIIVADRGYESYNTIAHLEINGLKYVIRIKTSGGIAHILNIPADKEADFSADILFTRRQTNEVKANPELYRYLSPSSTFDCLPKESKDTYPLMNILHLKSVTRIKKNTYIPSTPQITAENILNRDFHADKPNEKWLTDVTEFKYHDGTVVKKMYLSAILDLYDRRIVAYKIGDSNNNELVYSTFDEAKSHNPDAHPIFHSDRGFQYTNKTFHQKLVDAGMLQSMSRVGRCIDNGPMEGWWGILKSEMYYLRKFTNKEELISAIEEYISYYNTKRYQIRLSCMTPMEYHEAYPVA